VGRALALHRLAPRWLHHEIHTTPLSGSIHPALHQQFESVFHHAATPPMRPPLDANAARLRTPQFFAVCPKVKHQLFVGSLVGQRQRVKK